MQDAALCVHNIIRRRKASESNAFRLLFALSAQWHKEVSIVSFYCSTVVSALGSHSGSECAAAQSDPFAIKELASGVDLFCISDRACVPGSVIVELLAQGVF